MAHETNVLARLEADSPRRQLLVELVQGSEGRWEIRLRQQQWAEGLGWYDQKVMRLDPSQWQGLRHLLSHSPVVAPPQDASEPAVLPLGPRKSGSDLPAARTAVRGA